MASRDNQPLDAAAEVEHQREVAEQASIEAALDPDAVNGGVDVELPDQASERAVAVVEAATDNPKTVRLRTDKDEPQEGKTVAPEEPVFVSVPNFERVEVTADPKPVPRDQAVLLADVPYLVVEATE